MAKGCKKCDPEEMCEECPEWIFTLADLIMCMMGLFVILWVLKPGTKAETVGENVELNKVVAAIRDAFGYQPDPNSDDPVDALMILQQLERLKRNGPGEKGISRNSAQGAEGTDPEVTTIRTGRTAATGGRAMFAQGSAELTRETSDVLDQIVNQIRGHRNIVMIKGHTSKDDLPESATDQEEFDLSLRRAQAVINYLISKGVSPDTLRPQGCSTWEPVRQRAYDESQQAMNRRVEVEVTPTLVEELQDRPAQAPSPVTTNPND